MLTPMDIHNRDFKKATIRGYREDEVDEFLDRVVADYEKILRDNEKLKEQANLNEKEISQFRKLEKNMQDTLMVAQRTAEEVVSSANKNAEEMKKNAQLECQNIREQAQIEARRQIDEANSKLHSIRAEYDRLLREKNSFLLKIRTALETELAVTTQLLNSIPQSNEHDHLEQTPLSSTAPQVAQAQTTQAQTTQAQTTQAQTTQAQTTQLQTTQVQTTQPLKSSPSVQSTSKLDPIDSQATITLQKV